MEPSRIVIVTGPPASGKTTLATIRDRLDPALYLLDVPGTLVSVDTTSFAGVDYDGISEAVGRHLVTPKVQGAAPERDVGSAG